MQHYLMTIIVYKVTYFFVSIIFLLLRCISIVSSKTLDTESSSTPVSFVATISRQYEIPHEES